MSIRDPTRRLHAAWVAIALAFSALLPLIHARSHGLVSAHADRWVVDAEAPASQKCGHCTHAHGIASRFGHDNAPEEEGTPGHDQDHPRECDTCVQLLLCLSLGGSPLGNGTWIESGRVFDRVTLHDAGTNACEVPHDASPRGPPGA